MLGTSVARWAIALAGLVSVAFGADSVVYQDPETGFTFTSYTGLYSTNGNGITYRIAIPSGATYGSAFDVVLQVVVPNEVGWAGLSWGGSMTGAPLTVSWSNANKPVISSRWATSHAYPSAYTGATYTLLKTGTKSNSTAWQATVKCTGCTTWSGKALNPAGGNRLAFAYAAAKPSSPSSNTSSFNVHDVIGYWTHDFAGAVNPNFAALVTKDT